MTAVRPSPRTPQRASTGSPSGPRTVRVSKRPPVASTRASTVPSPPSAMGIFTTSCIGPGGQDAALHGLGRLDGGEAPLERVGGDEDAAGGAVTGRAPAASRTSCLPWFLPSKTRSSAAGAFASPSHHVDPVLEPALADPAGEGGHRLGGAGQVVEDDEALHPPALHDEREVVGRAGGGPGVVVVGDAAAEDDAAAQRQLGEDHVEHRAADVVEEDVDPLRAEGAEPPCRRRRTCSRRRRRDRARR